MCARGSGGDSEWVLTTEAPIADKHQAISSRLKTRRKYIQGERGAGRLLGPFQRDKMPEVHVSPLGVIPKSGPGKWRLILDFSSPEGGSVNDGITKELCSLSYMSVDEGSAIG